MTLDYIIAIVYLFVWWEDANIKYTALYIVILMRSFFSVNIGFSLSDYNILYVLFIWSWPQNN